MKIDRCSFRDDAKAPYEPVSAGSVMIERVARALDPAPFRRIDGGSAGQAWMNGFNARNVASDRRRISKARKQARAAIAAMRRPDMNQVLKESREYSIPPAVVDLIWTGLIDATLAQTAAGKASKARGQTEPVPISRSP